MELVVGTYDEIILGFRIIEVGKEVQIESSFTDRSHAGCVKCVAVSGKGVLASGGSDESIRLLNLRKQRELGSLVHHNGSITSICFHGSHMFSTSEDGNLCLWKTSTWECLRTFKGHKSAVNCVSVHPSGKLALTVGKDKALHTWNLITGRSAYITNIKQVADLVQWSTDGDKYVIVSNNKIDVYTVESAEVTSSITAQGRVNCIDFLNNTTIVYGGEGGCVYFHNISDNTAIHTCDTQTIRIKGLQITPNPLDDSDGDSKLLTIASSDGAIKLYSITHEEDKVSTELLVSHNSAFRITCMSVYCQESPKKIKEEIATNIEEVETANDEKTSNRSKRNRKRKLNKKKPDTNVPNDEQIDNIDSSKSVTKIKKRKIVDDNDDNESGKSLVKSNKTQQVSAPHSDDISPSKKKKKDKLKKKIKPVL